MTGLHPGKYDLVTRGLHAALALGVTAQLLLSAVMHVPSGPGLGVRDWHRAAFELHAHVGPWLAAVVALHWIWLFLPPSRPGLGYLFPWTKAQARSRLFVEIKDLLRLHAPRPANPSPLVGTVHGLGLAAVTGSAACGIALYLGYFAGVGIPRPALHWIALTHIVFGYLMWAFVVAHGSMAFAHWSAGWMPRPRNIVGER